MTTYLKSADTQLLVSKVNEVGKRKELDKTKLLNLSVSIAQSKSSTALEGIGTILSDNVVTPTEKKQLELTREQLASAYAILISEAEEYQKLDSWTDEQEQALQVYKTAYNAFLSELDKILADSEKNTTVNRQTFMALAQTYYDNQKNFDMILQMFRYGIDEIKFWYLRTEEYVKPASKDFMSTEPEELTSDYKYQWRKEVIYYTNGKAQEQIDLIGTYGDTGTGIESITNYYLASSLTSVTTETAGWNPDPSTQKISASALYLWNYEKITYTAGEPKCTLPCVIATYTKDGADGNSITGIKEKYASSSSNTEAPTTWYDSPADCPLDKDIRYLWNYEIISYSKIADTETQKRVIGVYGDTGDEGNGIESITNYYLATSLTTVTTETSGWDINPANQKVGPDKLYLWNYEYVAYTKTTGKATTPTIIGTYSKDGEDGTSITGVAEKYAVNNSPTEAPTGTWYDNPQDCSMSANNRYLWNYEIITYSKGNPTETKKKVIGVYGEKGDKGDGFTIQYNYSLSETAPNVGSGDCYWDADEMLWDSNTVVWMDWQDTAPEEREGYFIWIRVKLASGEWQYTRLTGKVGQGLIGTIQQYCLSSSSTLPPEEDDEGWTSIKPDLVTGKYLWTRFQYIWQNPYKITYSLTNLGDKVLLSTVYNYLATNIETKPDSLSFTDTGIPLDWNKDKPYLWQLIKYNYANGEVEYKISLFQTYHEMYITASPTSYTYDKRSKVDRTIQFTAEYCGYTNATIEWAVVSGGGTINEGLYTFPAESYPSSVTVRVTLNVDGVKREETTLEVFGTDVTEYEKFLGYAEEYPSVTILEGDYYVKSDGSAYEYRNGSWSKLNTLSNSDKILNALNGLLENDENLTKINNPNTISWFNSIVSKTITAETIKGIKGIFETIHISGKSELEGTVKNTVFETFQDEESTETYTASGGSTSEGNSNTVVAKAVLGKSVKANVEKRASTLTSLAVNTASGTLLGQSNFDKMMYISSVSTETQTVYNSTGSEIKEVTYTYTNPYPCPIKYYLSINAEAISREEEYTEVSAVLVQTGIEQKKSFTKPSTYEGDYVAWPDEDDVGNKYYFNRDITKNGDLYASYISSSTWNVYTEPETGYSEGYYNPVEGGTFTYTEILSKTIEGDQDNPRIKYHYIIKRFKWVYTYEYSYYQDEYQYQGYTSTHDVYYYGSISATNNGSKIYSPAGTSLQQVVSNLAVTLISGASLSVTLGVPDIQTYEGTVQDYGAVSVKWKSAENFNAGVAFFKSGSLSFYLSSLTDVIHTSSVSLTVNGTTWLNLPMESTTAWTYSSTYGAIYKIVKFLWTKGPSNASIVKTDDCLISASAVYYDTSHTKITPTTITSVSLTPTAVSASGTGTEVSLDTSTYVNYFSVSVTIQTKTKGVYSYNLMPLVDKSYSLGDSQHRWKSLRLSDWMLEQDSSGNLVFTRT